MQTGCQLQNWFEELVWQWTPAFIQVFDASKKCLWWPMWSHESHFIVAILLGHWTHRSSALEAVIQTCNVAAGCKTRSCLSCCSTAAFTAANKVVFVQTLGLPSAQMHLEQMNDCLLYDVPETFGACRNLWVLCHACIAHLCQHRWM